MSPERALLARPSGLLARVPDHWRTPLIQLAAVWLALIALFFGLTVGISIAIFLCYAMHIK